MKKVFIKLAIIVSCLIVGIVGIIFLTKVATAHRSSYYSQKLIESIRKKDVTNVEQIVEQHPTCVNAPHTSIPLGLYTFITEYRINYPILEACAAGNIEILNIIIDAGADVNCNNGLTPLSITYSSKVDNWYDISLILIESGASLDYVTEYSGGKSSVLQDIVQVRSGAALPGYKPESKEEVIKAFNYALEKCNHNNVNWMRVLQHSVSNDRIEIVKLLLDEGYCDVNDTSVGMTALMFAARDSNFEMVQLLLDYKADKSIKSTDGKTAYDYAVEFNDRDVISVLES